MNQLEVGGVLYWVSPTAPWLRDGKPDYEGMQRQRSGADSVDGDRQVATGGWGVRQGW